MSYKTREEGGYTVVELTGDVDLSCSIEARKVILDSLEGGRHVLVELVHRGGELLGKPVYDGLTHRIRGIIPRGRLVSVEHTGRVCLHFSRT